MFYTRSYFIIALLCCALFSLQAQNLYKTPSGKKFHTAQCRMVENVSAKLLNIDAIESYGLLPCKICKPKLSVSYNSALSTRNKAVGTSQSVQCKGKTKRGTRCRHKTRLANGYCYQHTKQNSTSVNYNNYQSSSSSICGARTQSGKACKRKVKSSKYCY